jgi:trans-2,3-dihydro-3-hydroxyanthranilate isomerase
MRLSYRIVNVFTVEGGRMTGNPLCVFEDASGLDVADMQALALQFNLAETSFVTPSTEGDARVRIFTPEYEMEFAGHPTLGTAHVVADMKGRSTEVDLELNVGLIPVKRDGRLWELRSKAAVTRAPKASRKELAAALGLGAADFGEPALWSNNGTEQLIVPLATEDAVRRVRPAYDRFVAATPDSARPSLYAFAQRPDGTLLSRYFYTQTGSMLEDPATGSATANLGGWYLANEPRLPLTRHISQGEMTGRPSALRLRIDAESHIFVAGEAIEIGRGYIEWR